MDRMTDSGSVGWAFESPRDHKEAANAASLFYRSDELVSVVGSGLRINFNSSRILF